MKKYFVIGVSLLTLAVSGCATRGYARKQAAAVNDRVTQVETQLTGLTSKHDAEVARVNERIATNDAKVQQAASSAAQAKESAARADASAAQAAKAR